MKRLFDWKRALAALASFLLLAGCAPAPAQTPSAQTSPAQASPTSERTFFAMDTVMTLRLYEGGDEALLAEAEDLVRKLEALWSVTDENSEIYALNRDGRSDGLSPDTAGLLDMALDMCEKTGGALDISVYPVLRAWGFTTGEYAVPEDEDLAALLGLVDYGQVRRDGSGVSLPEGMEIDLGSVAKGYTGWRLSRFLRENGVTSAMLDLGGNIQTIGSKPDGSPWRVGVQSPEEDGILGVAETVGRAVVTSGGYERYFEQDGVRYWHILDPKTGRPAGRGLLSATVVGEDGAVCDALSTALFVMGREEALSFWRRYRDELGFELVLVEDDGSVTVTAGLEDCFTLLQTERALTVERP